MTILTCSHCGFDVPNIHEFYLVVGRVRICERCHLYLTDNPTRIPKKLLREVEEILRGIESWLKEPA